jgi:hypothetical protein
MRFLLPGISVLFGTRADIEDEGPDLCQLEHLNAVGGAAAMILRPVSLAAHHESRCAYSGVLCGRSTSAADKNGLV